MGHIIYKKHRLWSIAFESYDIVPKIFENQPYNEETVC